jgi:hypothetical protein
MKAKLTPPGGDLNVWTAIIAVVGIVLVVLGCFALSIFAVAVGALYLFSVYGIWTGKPERKWYLVAFFSIATVWNVYVLLTSRYSAISVVLTFVAAMVVVRLITWTPKALEVGREEKPIPPPEPARPFGPSG